MQSLFDSSDHQAMLRRLDSLEAAAVRQWGKMDCAQMLAHCANALETATGERPLPRMLIGRILGPIARPGMLSQKPFAKNSPTHPQFVIADARDFAVERKRLRDVVDRFCERGPDEAARRIHAFVGRLTGDEWGRLMHKHLDHHLRQFGA